MCTCVLLKLRARQPYLFGHPSSWNLKPVKQSNRPHTFFLPRSGLSLWEEQATAVSLVLTKQSFHLFHILSELITFSAHYSPFYLSLYIFCLSVFYPAISSFVIENDVRACLSFCFLSRSFHIFVRPLRHAYMYTAPRCVVPAKGRQSFCPGLLCFFFPSFSTIFAKIFTLCICQSIGQQ